MAKPTKQQQRIALTTLCDPDNYFPIIKECITEKQAKSHRPIHMANVLALAAELYLLHWDSIAGSFDANNGELELTFKAKLAKDKDTVEVAFLPAARFKDSATATVEDEDEDQQPLGDIGKQARAEGRVPKEPGKLPEPPKIHALPDHGADPEVIDAEVIEDGPEENPDTTPPPESESDDNEIEEIG